MSISPVVDAEYRIHPADLQGSTRHVVVTNVTYQGVEAMTPVLHFAGQTKRLVMTPEHVSQMVEITGSILHEQWLGCHLLLQPRVAKRESSILIKAVTRNARGKPMPHFLSDDRRGWIMALSVVGILFVFSIVVAMLNSDVLLASWQQLQDYWPLR